MSFLELIKNRKGNTESSSVHKPLDIDQPTTYQPTNHPVTPIYHLQTRFVGGRDLNTYFKIHKEICALHNIKMPAKKLNLQTHYFIDR